MEKISKHPFVTIFLNPRETIRGVLKEDCTLCVVVLSILIGINKGFGFALKQNFGQKGYSLSKIIAISILVGIFNGIIMLYINSYFYYWLGKRYDGKASVNDLKKVFAYANIPSIIISILWIPKIALVKQEAFVSYSKVILNNPNISSTFNVISFLSLILGIWSLVNFVKCYSEVEGISTKQAILVVVIGFFVILLVLALITILLAPIIFTHKIN